MITHEQTEYHESATIKSIFLYFFQTVFAKGGHYAIKELSNCGYDVIGLDWTMSQEDARFVGF